VPLTLGVALSESFYTVLLRGYSRYGAGADAILAAPERAFILVAAASCAVYVLAVLAVSPTDRGVWLAFAPVLLTMALGGLYAAFLTASRRYAAAVMRVPAASLLALVTIVALLPRWSSTTAFAIGISTGHAVTLLVLVLLCRRLRRHRADSDERIAATALLVPAASVLLASLVSGQPVPVVERFLAHGLADGSVTWLVAARGLALLPAVIAQALGNGIFPAATEHAHALGRDALARLGLLGLRLGMLTALVSAALVVICRRELIQVALVRGDFTAADARKTAPLAAILAISLIGMTAATIAGKALFAIGRQRIVAAVTGGGLVLYVALAVLLRELFAARGLAVAFAVSSLVAGGILAGYLVRALQLPAKRVAIEALGAPLLLAGAFAAGALAGWLLVAVESPGFGSAAATLAASALAGTGALAVAIVLARGTEYRFARRTLGRGRMNAAV